MIGNVDGINNDYIQGWAVDEEDADNRVPLEVFYNGELLTSTVAGYPRADLLQADIGDGMNGFFVALPALDKPEDAEVYVMVAGTDQQLGATKTVSRRPRCSRTGILASEMLALHSTPLHSLQGLEFNGETIRMGGILLPPKGNPFSVRMRSTPGTEIKFRYPVHSPSAGDWYWYWPNSGWSGFQVEIDVPASTGDSPHFDLWFEWDGMDEEYTRMGRNHLRVPKDIGAYQNFPVGDQLTRVQRFDTNRRVALAGYNDHRQIAELAEHYGVDLPNSVVFDWGCGHGRVIRHFADRHRVKEAWGVDIDPENIEWLQAHVPSVNAATVPLLPPTDLPDQFVDLVYAISVMTHLTWDVQEAWLKELKRITKPGGLLFLTYCGPTSAAFASRFLYPEWLEQWQKTGFDDSIDSLDLNGKIGDDDYYRNTKQTPEVTREFWGRYFEVVDIHECLFGYQDVAVLRA